MVPIQDPANPWRGEENICSLTINVSEEEEDDLDGH
jgi:hypothetical protein